MEQTHTLEEEDSITGEASSAQKSQLQPLMAHPLMDSLSDLRWLDMPFVQMCLGVAAVSLPFMSRLLPLSCTGNVCVTILPAMAIFFYAMWKHSWYAVLNVTVFQAQLWVKDKTVIMWLLRRRLLRTLLLCLTYSVMSFFTVTSLMYLDLPFLGALIVMMLAFPWIYGAIFRTIAAFMQEKPKAQFGKFVSVILCALCYGFLSKIIAMGIWWMRSGLGFNSFISGTASHSCSAIHALMGASQVMDNALALLRDTIKPQIALSSMQWAAEIATFLFFFLKTSVISTMWSFPLCCVLYQAYKHRLAPEIIETTPYTPEQQGQDVMLMLGAMCIAGAGFVYIWQEL